MYIQKIFEVKRMTVLHEMMRANPMASLIVLTPDGLEANNVPFEIDTLGASGTLRCHVARVNPFWQNYARDTEALVIFQGPNGYISPRWYVNGQKSGKVLPGWNYAVVHAYGTMRIIDDEQWLMNHLAALAERNECGRSDPWKLDDAPRDFVKHAAAFIIGIEISITRLLGKWHVSQHRTEADRASVAEALLQENTSSAAALAELILQVDRSR